MAILRCNKCGYLAEIADTQAGKSQPCPKCETAAVAYPTLFFVEKLLDKYFDAQRELIRLKGQPAAPEGQPAADSSFDLTNTDRFATELQHGPIYDWFNRKQIKVQADLRRVDTSGFFDEVAEAIGANPGLLREVVDRLRWAQQKEHSSVTIHLDKKTPDEAAALSRFCQQLYDFSFVAKCFHNKAENNVRLILQSAPGIRNFFAGEWLEWLALMRSLRQTQERGKRFSCARGLELVLGNGDRYEIDVFLLIDGKTPICIECKSGEFRQNLDRYLALKKRLGLEPWQFVMCVAGLTDDSARGLSATYELSFVNETTLGQHLARVL
ncbi:DUF1887 family protein [Azonexus sp. R2A61]|uniref:DUF1887 family protein n=1 Tax=Azonexus sp. R2A61 TaxID=2744443 RepID=UPI001F1BE784|nr:DUF1887 family protein [Azonexus sp. R2A61]